MTERKRGQEEREVGNRRREGKWLRNCQKAKLGGKFSGGQGGERKREKERQMGGGRKKYGCAEGDRNE